MDRIDKDEELVCPLCGGRLFWMPVSHIYACEHCKQSYSERNGVYMKKKRKSTAEKSSAVGDCAKLRGALETLRELLGDLLRLGDAEYHNDFSNFCDIIDTALSAPPRNCDCFKTAAEAAHKRERGDAAKLREAVKAVVEVGYPHNFQHEAPHIRGYCYDITRAIDKCFAALDTTSNQTTQED